MNNNCCNSNQVRIILRDTRDSKTDPDQSAGWTYIYNQSFKKSVKTFRFRVKTQTCFAEMASSDKGSKIF